MTVPKHNFIEKAMGMAVNESICLPTLVCRRRMMETSRHHENNAGLPYFTKLMGVRRKY